jgi:hypothetical protein
MSILGKGEKEKRITQRHRVNRAAQRRGEKSRFLRTRSEPSVASLTSFLPSRLRVNRASGMTIFLAGEVASDEWPS